MGRSLPLTAIIVLTVFGIAGGIIWLAFSEAGSVYGEPPMIQASTDPLKRSPDDPGGRRVAALGGVGDLLREPANGPVEEQLVPSPKRPLSPAEAAVASLVQNGSSDGLEPDPEKRNETTAALQAIVDQINDDGAASSSGAGGPVATSNSTAGRPLTEDQALRPNEPETPAFPGQTTGQDQLARFEPTATSSGDQSYQVTPDGRFRVQLAAVREQEDARRAWSSFQQKLGPSIAGLEPFIERADTNNGTFYRVQVGPFAEGGEAEDLCIELQRNDVSCFVVSR